MTKDYSKMNHQRQDSNVRQAGISIVEVIITLVIVSLFATSFFQVYILLESQRVMMARQAKAYDIAYSNLRKVSARTGITCNTSGVDLTSGGMGYVLMPAADLTKALGSGAGQELKAYPSKTSGGCTGDNFTENPVKIESKVWFEVNGRRSEATHASYVQ